MHKALLATFLMMLGTASPVDAITGNKLLEVCDAGEQGGAIMVGYCLGFTNGLISGYQLGSPAQLCIPPGVSQKQIQDIVVKYVREDPSVRHLDVDLSSVLAVMVEFPC